ncbi:MAG: hypothetical protein WBM77_03075 [Maribacter sp.]
MRLNPEDFSQSLRTRNFKDASFNGLDTFVENLEKHFFSKISIREKSSFDEKTNLVIALNCNLTLWELIHQYDSGNWGTFNQSIYSLSNELDTLERINHIPIDVDEFSIILKDTTVIIDKIYNQSIGEQLDYILRELVTQYMHYTRGYAEVPYEIFVAVFAENMMQCELNLINSKKTQNYKSYWALYFESEIDAVIYDVQKSTFLYEDLYIVNQ